MLQCGVLGAAHLPILVGVLFSINLVLPRMGYSESFEYGIHLTGKSFCGCRLQRMLRKWVTAIVLGTTYVLAVLKSDVEPVFPYVSAAGDHQPESCVFGLLLNLSSVVSLVVIYLRYSLVTIMIRDSDAGSLMDKVNLASFVLGVIGGFSMMVIANFQETAVITIHLFAACLCFGSGCLYMIMQSWITVRMYPLYTNRRIGIIRSCITAISTISFFIAIGFGVHAANVFHRYYPDLPTPRPWNRKIWQPGYNYHVVSAVAEWIMAISHVAFIVSYSRDFEKLRASLYIESLVAHLDHSPILRSINDLRDI